MAKSTQEAALPTCFIIMPISDQDGYEAGHFGRVYNDIFKPACEKAGFIPNRGDDPKGTHLIHLEILRQLLDAPMAICDISSRNPNVLFELGLRQAFDKPTVLVKDFDTRDIFDIAPLRYASYHKELKYREVLADQESIAEAIKATADESKNSANVNSIVRLLSLSQPAELLKPDKDNTVSMLQVLMAEVGNLKRDLRQFNNDKNHLPRVELGVPSELRREKDARQILMLSMIEGNRRSVVLNYWYHYRDTVNSLSPQFRNTPEMLSRVKSLKADVDVYIEQLPPEKVDGPNDNS